MRNKIEDLLDKDEPLEIERAKVVAQVAQVLVESAKVEVKALEHIGGVVGSNFLQIEHEGK